MEFISVQQARTIIQNHSKKWGAEEVRFENALGRILAEGLTADRDLPPFNRSTMDGIAICFDAFEKGIRSFRIKTTQAAGEEPVAIRDNDECIEIMTGAALDDSVDTVIRYEDLVMEEGNATLKITNIKKGQSIHPKGKDKKQGETLTASGRVVTPALIGIAASIGKTKLLVNKLPKVLIFTTGDEMVGAGELPTAYRLRRSNDYTIQAVLKEYGLKADTIHLEDDYQLIKDQLDRSIQQYDVILMCGGVSMGKFDYVPRALEALSVNRLFHKVKQRPGKPFWFGNHVAGNTIFAFPGNPVSTFLCLHRYFLPWLRKSLGFPDLLPEYAILNRDIHFSPELEYFAQVKLAVNEHGKWIATPLEGNGSGDLVNLIFTNAFMELPVGKSDFKKGEVYRVWRYGFYHLLNSN